MNGWLLDTNALIFYISGHKALPLRISKIISHGIRVCVSAVSFLEIGIKRSIGKLDMRCSVSEIERACRAGNFEILSISCGYIDELMNIQSINDHKDPFDRLLIAQSRAEDLTLIICDEKIQKYRLIYNIKTLLYDKQFLA